MPRPSINDAMQKAKDAADALKARFG
ncbi:hypothetical protein C5167_041584 [Papaver somniferum]|nr:hypothetical protein C5167_041584 [Papaver somniferum]